MLTIEQIDSYPTNGWTLSKLSLGIIQKVVLSIPNKEIKVVEFGSGLSTKFLVDLRNTIADKNIQITSFDNDLRYSFDNSKEEVNLCIRNLVECTDENYQTMLKTKKYNPDLMFDKKTPLSTRQRNNFYDIRPGDLDNDYDLMILDGPNGNGRNIAFLHMLNKLKPNSYVFIDDFTHYNFVDTFLSLFSAEQIYINHKESIVLYKVLD